MLNGYFGNTGAGKTYGVVEYVVIPSLQEGRHIVTNIVLYGDLLTSIYGGSITQLPSDWYEDPNFADSIPPGAVLLLDECWRKWPAGSNVKSVPVKEMALLKEHRHRVDAKGRAMRVVLISQFASDLASWTRKLIDVSYRMEKLSALGASNTFHVDVIKGCPTGDSVPKKLIIQTRKGTYKPEIYQYYQSSTASETGLVGDESVADKRGNLWTSKWLWFCLIFGTCAVTLGPIYIIKGFFGHYEQQANPAAPAPAVEPPNAAASFVNPAPPGMELPEPGKAQPGQQQPASLGPSEPQDSTFWKVRGYVDVADKQDPTNLKRQVLIAGPYGERRFISFDHCQYLQGEKNVSCIVDGQRVTPWTGSGNAVSVLPVQLNQAPGAITGAERREAPAIAPGAHSAPVGQASQSSPPSRVTGIPYQPAPRTLL